MHSFDWNLVRSFLAALDHGSLLGAARALHTSQPTIGRHIAELERQWNTVLFERTGRGLIPTATAHALAQSARGMEHSALTLAQTLQAKESHIQGSVRITASVPVAVYLLPPVLSAMRLALPQVEVELVSSNAISNLLRREADIAIRMVRPDQGSLIAKKLGTVTLGAYAHRSYLARRGTPTTAEDLLHHVLIAGDKITAIQEGFAAQGHAVAPHHFALRTDDLIVQWQAVRAGLGIGFMADYVARNEPDVVAVLPTALRVPSLPMWLAVHREIRTNARIRAVYDFLAQALPQGL